MSLNNLKKMEKLDQLMEKNMRGRSPKHADARAALANMFTEKFANVYKYMYGDKAGTLTVPNSQRSNEYSNLTVTE